MFFHSEDKDESLIHHLSFFLSKINIKIKEKDSSKQDRKLVKLQESLFFFPSLFLSFIFIYPFRLFLSYKEIGLTTCHSAAQRAVWHNALFYNHFCISQQKRHKAQWKGYQLRIHTLLIKKYDVPLRVLFPIYPTTDKYWVNGGRSIYSI